MWENRKIITCFTVRISQFTAREARAGSVEKESLLMGAIDLRDNVLIKIDL